MLGDYKRRDLGNGLSIIGVENPALHLFAVSVMVHAGPRFEADEHRGLTHFLEHMIIQGSRDFPTSHDIICAVEGIGGVIDAGTRPESLDLYLGVHRAHWRRGLEIVSDVLLHPLFREEEVEQEKRIVLQELAQYRDDQQRNISVAELAHSLMFKERVDELGTRGSVEMTRSFGRALVCEQYERFFRPRSMVVSLAGGFDFDEVCAAMDSTLGAMPAGGAPSPIRREEAGRRRARAIYRRTERTPVVDVEICYRGFGLGDERFGAMLAASRILGGGLSSRLFTRVREELGLVYDVSSSAVTYSDTGSINVMLSSDVENLVEAFGATCDVVRQFREGGVSAEELEWCKESVRCGTDIMCDQPHELAEWLGRQELLLRPERLMTPQEFVQRQEALTCESMAEVIGQIFREEQGNLAVVGPFGEREADALRARFPAEEADAVGR